MPNHNLLHRFVRSRPHLSVAIGFGLVVALLLPASMAPIRRALVSWNVAVWLYLVSMAFVLLRADHREVKALAERQDENAGLVLATLTVASLMSLTAIVYELSHLGNVSDSERALRYAFTALTVFGSWFLVGTLFCIHYAHLFYRCGPAARPFRFPDDEDEPDYWDFLYFSFTIAVASQTSDVVLRSRSIRRAALAQSILSFYFNVAVLGLCVNIAAGLLGS